MIHDTLPAEFHLIEACLLQICLLYQLFCAPQNAPWIFPQVWFASLGPGLVLQLANSRSSFADSNSARNKIGILPGRLSKASLRELFNTIPIPVSTTCRFRPVE